MLLTLAIKNFVLIDDIEINFEKGFSVISGETGAGKSIILSALMLALGEKLSGKRVVRANCKEAVVSATFISSVDLQKYLDEYGVPESQEVIVRRRISEDGKSKFYINDIAVNNSTVSGLKDYLIEISGQHSSRGLLEKSNHIKLLDEFAGATQDVAEINKLYKEMKSLEAQYISLLDKKERSEVEREFLTDMLKELDDLNARNSEEDDLIEKRKALQDKHRIIEIMQKASQRFNSGGILTTLYSIEKDMERGGDLFTKALEPLLKGVSELREFEAQLEEIQNAFPSDYDLENLESRLFKIRSAARKYGFQSSLVEEFVSTKRRELDEIQDLDSTIKKTRESYDSAHERYLELSRKVSAKRAESAVKLKGRIEAHLSDLKMEKVEMNIVVRQAPDESHYTSNGIDFIEFLVRTNVGQQFGDISKTASGGELSRIMLSLKLALSENNMVTTIIFDEIDTGISGSVSSAVGRKLKELSSDMQVVAITHQPQVVASADAHLQVQKTSGDDVTVEVKALSQDEKVREIARMLSGEVITAESLAAAESLMREHGVAKAA